MTNEETAERLTSQRAGMQLLADRQRKSLRRKRWTFSAIALLILAMAAALIALNIPGASTWEVSGTVECTSGSAVQGVWVKEGAGAGGFANWDSDPGDPARARYSYDLRGDRYGVHVGCGGTREHWLVEIRSDYVTGVENDFVCHDVPGETNYRRCVLVS